MSNKSPFCPFDEIPERDYYFGNEYVQIMALEDFFQANDVFINPFTQRCCHSDSYGTIVSYENLEKALKALDDQFSPSLEDWKKFLDYEINNPNSQPPLLLVADYIKFYYRKR